MWLVMLTMSLATFLTRWLMLNIPEKYLTPRMKRGLLYVPIGIFIALIFPKLFLVDNHFTWQPTLLLASIIGFALYQWKRNFLLSFVVAVSISCIASFFE